MQTLLRLSRLGRTVRYLKMQQIAGQIRHRVIRSFERCKNGNGEGVEVYPGCVWPKSVQFLAPGTQENLAETIHHGTLQFLNRAVKVGFPPRWDCPELPKLWQYNLHYFEWLWALDYEDARLVVLDWIARHPLAKQAVGWEPYPTSLRLVNWCAMFFGRSRSKTEADRGFLQKLWVSLVRQAQWLERHLETHLLGNHYLENGAALAFIGSCFARGQAGGWFEKGCRILREQIAEQILPDGTHFELSPMYHCRVMYVLALLLATTDERLKSLVAEPLRRMSEALDCLCHPDGRIALLNDSAFGIYNEPHQLRSFCAGLLVDDVIRSCRPSDWFALPEAGYYGWRGREGSHVICDFGRIGPDYIPGHAHSDLFTFELSLRGRRVIVDTGVHDYEASGSRRYCRSTAAHNTVEVDGCDQCEMWDAFRVARRGYPQEVQWGPSSKGFRLSGWHNGYGRLRGKPVHLRTIEWNSERGLTVTDRITSSRVIRAVSRLHLHPTCAIVASEGCRIDIEQAGEQVGSVYCDEGVAMIEEGWYFPQFGLQERNTVLAFTKSGTDITLCYRIETNA